MVRRVDADRYEMGLKLQVANVSGEYLGEVSISDKREPEHYVLALQGQGSIGLMKGSAVFDLVPQGAAATLLTYAGSADVGGEVACEGQRVLSGVAHVLLGRCCNAYNHT